MFLTRLRGLVVACGVAAAVVPAVAQVRPGAAPTAPPTAEQRAALEADITRSLDQLRDKDRALPRTNFEPAAVIEEVGRDPANLREWVRDNTAWVPYRGALRGAVGVLNDRVGSDADRALLLAELFRQAGHECRLARATLGEADGAKRLASIPAPKPGVLAGSFDGASKDVLTRVNAHAPRLKAALGQVSGDAALADPVAVAAARDCWWVQRREGEQWVDERLDAAGGPAPTAEQTLPPPAAGGALSLPKEHVHEVDVRLVIEAFDAEAGKLVERRVVEATVRPAEQPGTFVAVRHFPMKLSAPPPPATATDPEAVRKGVLSQTEWLPVLEVSGRRVARRSFTDTGEVKDNPTLNGAAQIGGATGGLFGGLGGGLSGASGGGNRPPASVLTAQWLEYVVRSPGREPYTFRRPQFDVIGPAARAAGVAAAPKLDDAQRFERGLALAGVTESLVIGFSPSRRFAIHAAADELLAERELWQRILSEKNPARRAELGAMIRRKPPLLPLAAARRAFSPTRDRTYLDRPNVLNYRCVLRPDGQKLVTRHVMDLASNAVAAAGAGAFDARLTQGVADTAAEDSALAGAEPSPFNTLGVLEAPGAPAELVAVRDAAGAGPVLDRLNAKPDVRARVAADLQAGYAVVLPAKLPADARIGWWRVHPVTGETVGVMDSGYHQDVTEEAHLEDDTVIRAAEGLDKTFIRNRATPYWKQNYHVILRDMGANPNDLELAGMILDLQQKMLASGIWL